MPYKRLSVPWGVKGIEILWFLRTPRFVCATVIGAIAALALYRDRDQRRTWPERRSAFLGVLAGSLAMVGLFAVVFNQNQFYRYIYQYPTLLLLSGLSVVLVGHLPRL
jgi:peptidoglycan/LPS O-acetylase OafA/YrhL